MAMNQEFVDLVQEYLADGVISNQERQVLLRKAQKLGIDIDEAFYYIQSQEQKAENAQAEVERKEKGSICPHCKAPITEVADLCPKCHEPISPKASKELQEILANLEDALAEFKLAGSDSERKRQEVLLDRYIRKARIYENHTKVKMLIDEINYEKKIVTDRIQKEEEVLEKQERRDNIEVIIGFIILSLLVGGGFYYLSTL